MERWNSFVRVATRPLYQSIHHGGFEVPEMFPLCSYNPEAKPEANSGAAGSADVDSQNYIPRI